MSGLERKETAQRVRDAVRALADRRVSVGVPSLRIGRVITIDLPKLQGTVWFPGDPAPVGVSFFSNLIPGAWQQQNSFGDSTSLEGFGSMVACEVIRGALYVTKVLTGGQFSYNLKSLNVSVGGNREVTSSSGLQYVPTVETTLGINIVEEMNSGEACVFGPFVINSDSMFEMSWLEINSSEAFATRRYRFTMDFYADFQDEAPGTGGTQDRWYRVQPDQETVTNYVGDVSDLELDVFMTETEYGLQENGNQWQEVWFRFVNESPAMQLLSSNISIRSSFLHASGSVNGNKSLVSYVDTSPALIKGYLGFHNSKTHLYDLDDLAWRDRFNRTLSDSWGSFSDSPDIYTTSGGAGSNYAVDGSSGTISPTSAATNYRTFSNRSKTDFDFYAKFRANQLATGSWYEINFPVRQTATNNFYAFMVLINTGASVTVQIRKSLAGVETLVGAAVAGLGPFLVDQSFWMRGQLRGTEFRMKFWRDNVVEPTTWNIGETTTYSDTGITGAGNMGCMVRRNTGNTNTGLVVKFEELHCYTNPTSPPNPNEMNWSTGPYRAPSLRIAEALQQTWMHDGNMTWDGTYIKWTGRIWFTGVGRFGRGLADGLASVSCPTASYSIPVLGGSSSGNTLATMTTSGIPLAAGQSLWCAIPPGVKDLDLMHHLFIVDSTPRSAYQVRIPEWAVLIAARQPTTAAAGAIPIRLGNGTFLDKWHVVGSGGGEPAFAAGWSSLATVAAVAFKKIDQERVMLQGYAVSAGAISPASTIFTLPVGYRPGATYIVLKGHAPASTTVPTPRGLAILASGLVQCTFFPAATNPGQVEMSTIFSTTSPVA